MGAAMTAITNKLQPHPNTAPGCQPGEDCDAQVGGNKKTIKLTKEHKDFINSKHFTKAAPHLVDALETFIVEHHDELVKHMAKHMDKHSDFKKIMIDFHKTKHKSKSKNMSKLRKKKKTKRLR